MKLIQRSDIKGPAAYADVRDAFRKRNIELKRDRRVIIGDRVSMVFENRQTLISQIEEMLRCENLTSDDEIDAEIEVYNEIMPSDDSLSATLFLEVPPGTDPRTELDRLIGLDEHLILHVGNQQVRAVFEEGRGSTERISAVQYCRFPLSPQLLGAMKTEGTQIAIQIDHPGYQYSGSCSEAMRASLAADYAEEAN